MENWPERLSKGSPERESSLAELRRVVLKGLRASLSGRAAADTAFLEDVSQTALLKIIENLDTYEGRSRFTSWTMSIALRVAFNELRRAEWKNVSLEQLRVDRGMEGEERNEEPSPDESLQRDSMIGLIRKTIKEALTERQRAVLLAELSGMPQEEIARQVGSSRNAVYKLFHDARKALRRELEKRGFGLDEMRDHFATLNRKTNR